MKDTIQRTKLHEDVANLMLGKIQDGEWAPGDRLPAETALASRFDVSRSTVRAAIRSLQSQRVIVSRAGSGSYVTERAPVILQARAMSDIMATPEIYRDLVQTRCLIEPGLAGLAARQAEPDEAAALIDVAERMLDTDDRDALMRLGYDFHMMLAAMSHNRVLVEFYRYVSAQLRSMRAADFLTAEVYRRGAREHFDIARAILEGDPEEAARRMRRHLYAAYMDFAVESGDDTPAL